MSLVPYFIYSSNIISDHFYRFSTNNNFLSILNVGQNWKIINIPLRLFFKQIPLLLLFGSHVGEKYGHTTRAQRNMIDRVPLTLCEPVKKILRR